MPGPTPTGNLDFGSRNGEAWRAEEGSALMSALEWRYAAKAYDRNRTVPEDKLARILDAIWLAPSSSGLQPFDVLVVTNREIRSQLTPWTMDQRQIAECSHVLVFAAWDNYTADRINRMYDYMLEVREMEPTEGFIAYRQRLLDKYPLRDPALNFEHAARQSYIAFGFGLLAAALEGVDSTPVEGFDPARYDEILGLKALGLRSAIVMCLGFRNAEEDWLVNLPKVRRAKSEFFVELP